MSQDIGTKDIENVYLNRAYLLDHPAGAQFFLQKYPYCVEIRIPLGENSHRIFLDTVLSWYNERYARIQRKTYSFFHRWVDTCLLTAPLLTHKTQDYNHFTEYVDEISSHKKVLDRLDNDRYVQYAQDQFDIDIRSVDGITNRQYFKGLIP